MKRWFIYSLLALFILLVIIISGAIWIATTESGLHFLVNQAQRWAPGQLQIKNLTGRLSDKLSFKEFSYQHADTSIAIDSLQLHWEASALLKRNLHINQLYIDGVRANFPKSEKKESTPLKIPNIRLPVSIALDDIKINQVTINSTEAKPIVIDKIELRSNTTDKLSLQHLQINSPLFQAKLVGELGLVTPHPVQLDLDWSVHLPQFTVVGQGKLSGDTQELVLTHTISQPLAVAITATAKDLLGNLNGDAHLQWQEIYWPFNAARVQDYLVHSQQGQLNLTGSLEDYHVDFKSKISGKNLPSGNWNLLAQGNRQQLKLEKLSSQWLQGQIDASGQVSWNPQLAGQIQLDVDEINLREFWSGWPEPLRLDSQLIAEVEKDSFKIEKLTVDLPTTATQLTLQGEGRLAGAHSRLNTANLTWQNLQWPLLGETTMVTSNQGQINLAGNWQSYRLDLDAQLTGNRLPKSHWLIQGQGNPQQLQIKSLRTETLQGLIAATGKVGWQPQLNAQINLQADQLMIKELWPNWPEPLRLNSQLVAQLDDKNFKINQLNLNIPQTATQLILQGEGTLTPNTPQLKAVTLQWQDVQWPLAGEKPLITSSNGQLNLAGTMQDYQLELTTQLAGTQFPPGRWQLAGQGNRQQFEIQSLNSSWLAGVLQGTGTVAWQPQLAAQVNLNASQLNIKDFWPKWPESLRLNSQLKAKLDGDKFNIQQFAIELPATATHLALQGQGTVAGQNSQLEQAQLTWQQIQWPLSGNQILVSSNQGQLDVSGTLPDYRVKLAAHLGGAQIPSGQWLVHGRGNGQQFTIESLQSQILAGELAGHAQMAWQPAVAAQVVLTAKQLNLQPLWEQWPTQLNLNSQLTANLAGDQVKIEQWQMSLPQTNTQLSLQGEGKLAGDDSHFESNLSWQNLAWPLAVAKPAEGLAYSHHGQLLVKGTLQDYQLQLDTQLEGKNIPSGRWQANGQGDNRHFQLKTLQGQILQGILNLQGEAGWQPERYWQLILKGDRLNPGVKWEQWPGQLRLDIHSQGRINQGILETQLQIKPLQGQLRHYPLQFQTEITSKGPAYQIKQLELKSGPSTITANGQLDQHSQLKWAMNIPNLATLLPDGQGKFNGQGLITGPLNLPHLVAQVTANSLAFQDKQLAALQADVDINLLGKQDLQVKVMATDFKQGNTQIKQASFQSQGTVASHSLLAKVISPHEQLAWQLTGGLVASRWQGQLQQLDLTSSKAGHWQLQTPSSLMLSSSAAQLTESCLQNQHDAKLCTQFNWQQQAESRINILLKRLPLNLARVVLPGTTDLTGAIDGKVAATLQADGEVTSTVLINVSSGVVTTELSDETKQLAFQGGTFQLQINPQQGLAANLNLGLFKPNDIQGTLNLPQFTHLPPQKKQPLQGKLQAHFADLAQLPQLINQAENLRGQVNLDVAVNGTLATPQIQGQIRIQEAAFDLPDLGLEMKDFNLLLKNQAAETLQLQASLNSGKTGQLNLQGKMLSVLNPNWQANLTISGKNFEVINNPMAWALVSPDLQVQLHPGRIDVTGEVTVPQALITPSKTENTAIMVSKDIIEINPQVAETQEKPPLTEKLAISSRVKVILGNKVSFKGAGFKSRIEGAIVASNQPGKMTIGNGELKIVEGSYKAYGQNLQIDQGRIIFTGGLIENPGLDIKAYRRIKNAGKNYHQLSIGDDDVVAGVYIQGTAQSPRLTLFSLPSLDESNTLSYIILGKPAAQATESEGNTLLRAATAMSLKEGDSLTQAIGQQFGFDEVGISSEGGVEEAALVVGKYLTPGLYVSYGVGLFDGSNILRMRYELTKRLTLETETGTQSGVDLRYTWER
jgi:translocation and assembly module TamB